MRWILTKVDNYYLREGDNYTVITTYQYIKLTVNIGRRHAVWAELHWKEDVPRIVPTLFSAEPRSALTGMHPIDPKDNERIKMGLQ